MSGYMEIALQEVELQVRLIISNFMFSMKRGLKNSLTGGILGEILFKLGYFFCKSIFEYHCCAYMRSCQIFYAQTYDACMTETSLQYVPNVVPYCC